MKCSYEFNQSKLKSQLITLLQNEVPGIDFNVKENRREISQLHIFFAAMVMKQEMSPKQLISIVEMDPIVQGHTLDALTFMKACERRKLFSHVERCDFEVKDLFLIHQKRQNSLPSKCIICDYKKNARQTYIRNGNKTISDAKKRAVHWKSISDFPKSKLFCFNHDGMNLSIQLSSNAKSLLHMRQEMPPIDIHVSLI